VPDVLFSDQAKLDLGAAFSHYLALSPRIADRFEQSLAEVKNRLIEWPDSGRPIQQYAIRKVKLARFPYALLYEKQATHVNVLRVIDLRSDPKRWLG